MAATGPNTDSDTPPRPEYRAYVEIVWEQFEKYPFSYWSLWGILVLFVVATLAPAFALNVPFYINVPESAATPLVPAGVHYPWFSSLFNQNFFETALDTFFNFLIFALPVVLLAWVAARRMREFEDKKAYRRFRFRYILAAGFVLLVGAIVVYSIDFRTPYIDWITIATKDGVDAVFPFLEFSYRDTDITSTGLDPSWQHWLGTDRQGRDVFTRILYGTRISLTVGVVAVGIYVTIGVILGSLGGYFGGWVDNVILRLIEVQICFPVLFLILTLRGFIENPSIFHIMLLIGITGWPKIARLVRGEFLRLKNEDFVAAAEALGLPRKKIIFRHVLPNGLGPVFVAATFGVAGAILIEATLSFLGLGSPTSPSWGQILTAGKEMTAMAPILASGFAIFVTVSLLNLVGEGARDALDPKLRK